MKYLQRLTEPGTVINLYRTTTGGVSSGWTPMNVTRDNTEAPHSLEELYRSVMPAII